jgi:hypothetical protein
MVEGHIYSVLEAYQINERYLFKIRNPWGYFEWNGEYGDNSSLWTPELKQKVGFKA